MPRRPLNVTPEDATLPIPPLPGGTKAKPGKRTATVNELIDHNIHKITDVMLYRCINLKDGRACEYLLNRRLGLPKIHLESVNLNINADDLAKQLAASQVELQQFLTQYLPQNLPLKHQNPQLAMPQSSERDNAGVIDEAPGLSGNG